MEEDGRWFFSMELIRGVDFIEYIRGRTTVDGSPSRDVLTRATPRTDEPPAADLALRTLTSSAHIPAGDAFELDLIGERVTCEVWYRSDHQLGLTVDAWGNGLLVLSHIPPGDGKPDGATMAILSLYGDVDRDAVDARWRAWWSERWPEELELPTEP